MDKCRDEARRRREREARKRLVMLAEVVRLDDGSHGVRVVSLGVGPEVDVKGVKAGPGIALAAAFMVAAVKDGLALFEEAYEAVKRDLAVQAAKAQLRSDGVSFEQWLEQLEELEEGDGLEVDGE